MWLHAGGQSAGLQMLEVVEPVEEFHAGSRHTKREHRVSASICRLGRGSIALTLALWFSIFQAVPLLLQEDASRLGFCVFVLRYPCVRLLHSRPSHRLRWAVWSRVRAVAHRQAIRHLPAVSAAR